ncbi:MAG: chemotaxis protein CheA [Rhodocyclaceae bacterium]|nr:MAG: chemotaxis protein CheA [Rhodocyclaceae bacterium]
MAIDMSQFYQVFFEEAAEHLENMESLLLALDVDAPDEEQLNAIFRAAHSIKGSAGTFGFTDLAEVTHVLENLLDRLRKGELALRNDMIDAFLDAGDVLKGLLAAHRGEGRADPAAVEGICARLKELTQGDEVAGTTTLAASAGSDGVGVASAGAGQGYVLRFILEESGDVGRIGDDLLTTLGELGALVAVHRPAADQRAEPWQIEIDTSHPEAEIREILEFVARSDSLRITLRSVPATPAEEDAYGFFDQEPAADETNLVSTPMDDAEGAFGFFDPLPSDAETPAAAGDDPGGAFGFFLPVPGGDFAEADPAPAVEVSADDPSGAFGFFTPVAPPPAAPSAAVLSMPTEERGNKRPAAAAKPAAAAEATIRVGVEKVDQLINLIGELVITQAMLAQSASSLDPVEFERLHNGLAQLERNTRDMQESVMSIRMMPISVVFSRFPRVARDISSKLGKRVELKMIGEHTELDRSLIERITDPLTHLVRNSLDHGIEMPEDRAAKGKQPVGTITLKAYHQSGNIVIEVSDDGAGLNRQKILSKAKERGIAAAHDGMSDHEVWQLIFEPGFSTADQITEVSGRGVGMDVVKRNITSMGGRVEIDSMAGVGTRMTVRLPLTLAILDGMSVAVGRETYIIPLGYVIESLQASRSMIKSVSGVERLIQVRDEYLPVVALYEVFGVASAQTRLEEGIMIVLEADGIKAAMFVDALVGQHQVVIKSLEANYRKIPGISGATIMGDGHVALILDVAALVAMARSAVPAAA